MGGDQATMLNISKSKKNFIEEAKKKGIRVGNARYSR